MNISLHSKTKSVEQNLISLAPVSGTCLIDQLFPTKVLQGSNSIHQPLILTLRCILLYPRTEDAATDHLLKSPNKLFFKVLVRQTYRYDQTLDLFLSYYDLTHPSQLGIPKRASQGTTKFNILQYLWFFTTFKKISLLFLHQQWGDFTV